jgi:hypothetical protein
VENTKQAAPLTITEAEKFWTDGRDALQSATGANPETLTTDELVGIDLPGVGHTRPHISPDCAGRESAAGEVPQRDLPGGVVYEPPNERRERLFSQLVFAAKDLAEAQIEPADAVSDEPAFCTECVADEHRGVMQHERACRTGRVLEVLADLTATVKPSQKEAATDGETPAAGDGIRPRGLTGPTAASDDWAGELICARCGAHGGGSWHLVSQSLRPLGWELLSHQCEVRKSGWSYRYAHDCITAEREGGAR